MPIFSKITENSKKRVSECVSRVREERKAKPKATKEMMYKIERLNEVLAQKGHAPVSDDEISSYASDYKDFDLSSI